jgi:hypothetical protein
MIRTSTWRQSRTISAGVSVFADEDFAEYGLDEPRITDLRNWVTGWYGDLALRLAADLTDDETPDDL